MALGVDGASEQPLLFSLLPPPPLLLYPFTPWPCSVCISCSIVNELQYSISTAQHVDGCQIRAQIGGGTPSPASTQKGLHRFGLRAANKDKRCCQLAFKQADAIPIHPSLLPMLEVTLKLKLNDVREMQLKFGIHLQYSDKDMLYIAYISYIPNTIYYSISPTLYITIFIVKRTLNCNNLCSKLCDMFALTSIISIWQIRIQVLMSACVYFYLMVAYLSALCLFAASRYFCYLKILIYLVTLRYLLKYIYAS